MIQLFNAEHSRERDRIRAIAAGELRDVTREAREYGFTEKVCISNRLWTSLIRPYPFAEPNDCLSLSTLLRTLKQHLLEPSSANVSMLLLLPPDVPEWFRGPCYLRVLSNSLKRGPDSIVVRPLSEPFHRCAEHREESLPVTLLVRLTETLSSLTFVARTPDKCLIGSMHTIATELIRSNPFHRDILAHFGAVSPDTSLSCPPDDVRSALLADLDELLAVLSQCANVKTRPTIEALKSRYRALVSPLAAFCQILEDLLRFAVSGSNATFPFQAQAFSLLLGLHADIISRLQRLETQVPRDALAVVRFQIRLLSQVLATPDSQFLADIERACASLVYDPLSHSTHGPARECRRAVVWH